MSLLYRLKFTFYAFVKHSKWFAVVALGEEPRGHLFGVKREEMSEGRKGGWASKIEPGPFLSSKSGSATGLNPGARVVWGRVVLKRTVFDVFACARSKKCSALLLNYANLANFITPRISGCKMGT